MNRDHVRGRSRYGIRPLLLSGAAGLLIASCIHQDAGDRPIADASACSELDLAEAAFRHQFAANRSGISKRAAAYFIEMPAGEDPPPELLRRFRGQRPPVRAASLAQLRAGRVTDPETGKRALLFRIDAIEYAGQYRAIVRAGYYESELSASWLSLAASCDGGRWLLEQRGPVMISQRRAIGATETESTARARQPA